MIRLRKWLGVNDFRGICFTVTELQSVGIGFLAAFGVGTGIDIGIEWRRVYHLGMSS